MTDFRKKKSPAIGAVLSFVFRHWRNQPVRLSVVAGGLAAAAVADVLMPLFAGRLGDGVGQAGTDQAAAHRSAGIAFGAIVALGFAAMVVRFIGLKAILPCTLRLMSDVALPTFVGIQHFPADYDAS